MAAPVPDPLLDQPAGGRFLGREHRLALRVYFEDTDVSGVAYHANYLRWMERARSDMLRLLGIDQRAAYENGVGAYAVAEINIRYRAPARLDDALLIASRLTILRPASSRIHQRVIRGEEILAEAEVLAALVTPAGRPRRQPAEWMAAFAPFICSEA